MNDQTRIKLFTLKFDRLLRSFKYLILDMIAYYDAVYLEELDIEKLEITTKNYYNELQKILHNQKDIIGDDPLFEEVVKTNSQFISAQNSVESIIHRIIDAIGSKTYNSIEKNIIDLVVYCKHLQEIEI